MSVCLEKANFLIVADFHAMATGWAGIVAYGFEPTALLYLLVATTWAWVTKENLK